MSRLFAFGPKALCSSLARVRRTLTELCAFACLNVFDPPSSHAGSAGILSTTRIITHSVVRRKGSSNVCTPSPALLIQIRRGDSSFSDELVIRPCCLAHGTFLSALHAEEVLDAVIM